MRFHRSQFGYFLMLLTLTGVGCRSIYKDSNQLSQCEECDDEDGPRRWTAEWYEIENQRPEGARQKKFAGQHWPPYERPVGKGQQFTTRFHSAHYWPYPYNMQDRCFLRTVSDAQVNNGWIKEATLYDYHFDEKDNSLNHAGRNHLIWIVQTIPEQRRFVWVQASTDKKVTDARLDHVKKETAKLAGDANVPPVMVRITPTDGRPAEDINRMRKAMLDSTLPPRIEYTSPSLGAAGSAGGT